MAQQRFSDDDLLAILNDPSFTDEDMASFSDDERTRLQAILQAGGVLREQDTPGLPSTFLPQSRGEMGPLGPEEMKAIISGSLRALSVPASMFPGSAAGVPTLLRILLPTLLNTGATAVEGGGGKDILGEATLQTALGGGGEGAARAIPYLSNMLAAAFGGSVRQAERGAGAFTRYNRRHPLAPILVGEQKRTAAAVKKAGGRIGRAEERSPAQWNLAEGVEGANRGVVENARSVPQGLDLIDEVSDFSKSTLKQQAILRNKPAGMPLDEWRELWETGIPPTVPPDLWKKMKAIDRIRAREAWHDAIIKGTNLPVREAGNMQRAITHGKGGSVVKARVEAPRGKIAVAEADTGPRKVLATNLADEIRRFRHGPADVGGELGMWQKLLGAEPRPGQKGAIKAADSLFGDTATMHSLVKSMRAPGFIPRDPGMIAIRGALGAGVGGLAGGMAGGGEGAGLGAGIGSLVGPFALNPKLISALGIAGGKTAAPITPALLRYLGASESFKGTKRRTPWSGVKF